MSEQTKSNLISFAVGFLGFYITAAFGFTLCLPLVAIMSWLSGNIGSFFGFGKVYIAVLLLAFIDYLLIKRFENKINISVTETGFQISVVIHTLAVLSLLILQK